MFKAIMKIKSAHSALLQSVGFSKNFIRDHSPIHKLLTSVAFKLAKGVTA